MIRQDLVSLVADARACGLAREARAIWCDTFSGVTLRGGSADDAAVAAGLACRVLLDALRPHVGRCARGGAA